MKNLRRSGVGRSTRVCGVSILTLFLAASCAKDSDHKQVEAAIARLQSGALIDALNAHSASSATKAPNPKDLVSAPAPVAAVTEDPCAKTAIVPLMANASQDQKAAMELGACMRGLLNPVEVASRAIRHFRSFNLVEGTRQLSEMSDQEISDYLNLNDANIFSLFGIQSPKEARLRKSFSDADLDEFLKLVGRRKAALSKLEAQVFAAVTPRKELIGRLAKLSDRYELLLALYTTAGDTKGDATGAAVRAILNKSGMPAPGAGEFPHQLLHPHAIMSVIPEAGHELDPMDDESENPYRALLAALAELGGPEALVKLQRNAYVQVRNVDNPPIPDHAPAAKDAVRVAFIDTGIDFVKHPDLGLFLGHGSGGEIASGDFADMDGNPWVPAIDMLEHGSGTSATLLTILAHHAPEVLRDRKLDLAMWKVETARNLLSGPLSGMISWENRLAVPEAIVHSIESSGVKPKIVSVSMGFYLDQFLKQAKKSDILLKAPWLWVMAAGNSGLKVQNEPMSTCFNDVDPARRRDENILCVGALVQGIVNDKIASYSNYGDRVDVYAFESYIGLCPNGTSCSTPSVAAAATAIAAKNPALTPAQIKQVIVQAAETRKLAVDLDLNDPKVQMGIELGLISAEDREVRVFDPSTMLPKALQIAEKMALGARKLP